MKKIFSYVIAYASMGITLVSATCTLSGMCYLMSLLEQQIGCPFGHWTTLALHITLLFTVIIDTTVFVEMNVMRFLDKLGAFKAFNTNMCIPVFWYPHSCIYMLVKNIKKGK